MSISKQDLITGLAVKLKPILRKPEWADFVKTGVHKERPPADSDWWFMRGASILVKVQKLQPVGIAKLRVQYGGKKNMGVAPEHTFKGSGSIIRKLMQQLEQAGFVKQEVRAGHKGRVITAKAQSLIAQTTKELEKAKPKEEPRQAEPKHEDKAEKPEVKVEAHKEAKPEAHKEAHAKKENTQPAVVEKKDIVVEKKEEN